MPLRFPPVNAAHNGMIFIYFLYTLPFFILSVIVLIHIKRESQFFFLKNMWLIAVFAIAHGTHELNEMVSGFREPTGLFLNFADAFFLAVSFYCLIQFGINCIICCKQGSRWLNVIPPMMALLWVVALISQHYNFVAEGKGDIFARYILGIPGCALTSYAFLLNRPGIKNTGQPGLVRSATLAAAGFAFFGLVSAAIVPKAAFFPASILNYDAFYSRAGVPIQIIRAVTAAFIGYNILRLMRIFEWETAYRAGKEKEDLRNKIEERTSQLDTSLKERETLLRELYHRTKNNMQLISSLISLQAADMNDDRCRQMSVESQNRILAMSMVHEKLYQSARLSDVNIREYIADFAKALLASYNLEQRIALKLDLENIQFGIDMAIPCGLIINELMTNSLKYAFPEGRPGEVSIVLHHLDGKKVQLAFADNGIGLPPGFDLTRVKSLGLRLLKNLATQQLRGDVRLDFNHGCRYEVTFETNGQYMDKTGAL